MFAGVPGGGDALQHQCERKMRELEGYSRRMKSEICSYCDEVDGAVQCVMALKPVCFPVSVTISLQKLCSLCKLIVKQELDDWTAIQFFSA